MHSSLQKTKEDIKLLRTDLKPPDKVELLKLVTDLQVCVDSGKEDVVVEEKMILPLRNFVEQVVCQKFEVSVMGSSKENPATELQVDEMIHGYRFSHTILSKEKLRVRKTSVKRRYHRIRIKQSLGYCSVKHKQERAHFKGTRSFVDTFLKLGSISSDFGFQSQETDILKLDGFLESDLMRNSHSPVGKMVKRGENTHTQRVIGDSSLLEVYDPCKKQSLYLKPKVSMLVSSTEHPTLKRPQVEKKNKEGISREYSELDIIWFIAGSLFHKYPFDIPAEAFTIEILKQVFVAIQPCVVHLPNLALASQVALVPLGTPLLAYCSNCKTMLTAVGGAVELVVDRPFKAGDHIDVWCKPQPNAKLLMGYGFVDENNPYNRIIVEATLSTADPQYQDKRMVSQRKGKLSQQVFQVRVGKEREAVQGMLPYLQLGYMADPAEIQSVIVFQGPVLRFIRPFQSLKLCQSMGLLMDCGAVTYFISEALVFHLKLYVWDPGQVKLHKGIVWIILMEKCGPFVSVAHEKEQLDIGQKMVTEWFMRTYYMGKSKLAPDCILSEKAHSLKWKMFFLANTFTQLEDKLVLLVASNSMWRMMFRDIRKTQSKEDMSELSLTNKVWEPGGILLEHDQWSAVREGDLNWLVERSVDSNEHRPRTPPDLPFTLLDERILCMGRIHLVLAVTELVVAELKYIRWLDSKEPICNCINSTGTTGDDGETVRMESDGFVIYDSLMQLKSEVQAVCDAPLFISQESVVVRFNGQFEKRFLKGDKLMFAEDSRKGCIDEEDYSKLQQLVDVTLLKSEQKQLELSTVPRIQIFQDGEAKLHTYELLEAMLLRVQSLEKRKKLHKTRKFKYKSDFGLRLLLQAEREKRCDSGDRKFHVEYKWELYNLRRFKYKDKSQDRVKTQQILMNLPNSKFGRSFKNNGLSLVKERAGRGTITT